MTTPTDIADRIESARHRAQRSVAWLSETAGIADKTLRRRYKAPAQFTLSELVAIANALETDLETFFAEETTQNVVADTAQASDLAVAS